MTTLISPPLQLSEPNRQGLAAYGGPRAVTEPYRERWKHVRLRDAVPILKSIWRGRTTSPKGQFGVQEFEREFAKLCGSQFALAMNSGTAALHSGLFAVGVGVGDEVVLPAYTFHASASAVLASGATPVFCEVDPRTLTLDPNDLERRITERTRAIMVVHVWGNPAEMDRICRIAKARRIPIVEDCSHAHGASYKGKSVGSWGDVGCFSLQGEKAVSAGEGGVAVCADEVILDRMLALGQPVRTGSGMLSGQFNVGSMHLGPKYRSHLFGILLAKKSLDRLGELNNRRRRNWQMLCEELRSCEGIRPIDTLDGAQRGGFLEFMFALDDRLGVCRDRFVELAVAEGVPVQPDRYFPLHGERVFRSEHPLSIQILDAQCAVAPAPKLPVTETICQCTVKMPALTKVPESYVRQCGKGLAKIANFLLAESLRGGSITHPNCLDESSPGRPL